MLSAAAWNSNYGGAGLLRPHLGDPVTLLAPFWGSHLIPLFTLPVSVGEPCPEPPPQRVTQRLSHPAPPGPAPAPAHPGCLAKRNPIRIGGAPPSACISPLFAFWAFLGESGLFLSPDQRPLTSPPPPSPQRAFYSASNFRGGCVPAALGSPPLLLTVLPKGGEDFS